MAPLVRLGRPIGNSRLAVLPLTNLSGDPEQEYLADGITEELITDLAKISALKVISRTSMMHYKGTNKTLPEIARELNVEAVVEGSVQRAGHRIKINAQLIRAATDEHIWAERYERESQDVLRMEELVAKDIANAIKVNLTPEEKARLASARPVNPEAYEAYLKGRFHWTKRTDNELRTAIEYFQRAIEKDPNFLAEAHATLASIRDTIDWDWAVAEDEYKRDQVLGPHFEILPAKDGTGSGQPGVAARRQGRARGASSC